MPDSARILFLLNPGRQSRLYLIGLLNAARRLDIPCAGVELGPLWDALTAAPDKPAVARAIADHLRALVERERFTHALGYACNGVELGRAPGAPASVPPLLTSLGLTHLMLWTDHPNWMSGGMALQPATRAFLAHPRHVHFLKSPAAAREASAVLAWPNVHALDMAEDYDLLPPARAVRPVFDAVVISGSAYPLHPAVAPFLGSDDPDPASIDRAMMPAARAAAAAHLDPPAVDAILGAKLEHPLTPVHELACALAPAFPSLHGALADPLRWFPAAAALRQMSDWRRAFWIAWLARRARVGVFGCDASPWGLAQSPDQKHWIDYARQPDTYALGAAALTINAAHDEERCSHKPFQVAASAVPCVHHASRGLPDLFTPGAEILPFSRGSELLHAVRSAAPAQGRAMLARARRDHTWTLRLQSMLALAP